MTLDFYPISNYLWVVINGHHGAERKKHTKQLYLLQCTMTKPSYRMFLSVEMYNEFI